MAKIEPGWDYDEKYQTNIRSCPAGYTFVGGYRTKRGKHIRSYCKKLGEGEKSRTAELVYKREDHRKKVDEAIAMSAVLPDKEWYKEYGRLFKDKGERKIPMIYEVRRE